MSVYCRGVWYWYKRMLGGHVYYRPLKVRKGQESLLSARIAQEDESIVASHYGLPHPTAYCNVTLSEYRAKFLEAKKHKKTIDRDRRRRDDRWRLAGLAA